MIYKFYHNGRQPVPRGGKGPQVLSDYEGYQCPVTDKWVEGRYAHRENLKRTNSRLLEPGEKREAPNRGERNFETTVDRIVTETLERSAG